MYSVMIFFGIVFCFIFLEVFYYHKNGSRRLTSAIEINGCIAIGVGFLFALLFQNLYDFIENPSTYTWTWAITFFGGLIGGVASFLVGYFCLLRKKYGPFMQDLLVIAPACITIAHGLGRIGCYLAGCCYGIETTSPLGVQFGTSLTSVWPTNLFEALFLIVLSIVLLYLAVFKNSAYCFPIYMLSYGAWRFGIEFIRGDHRGEFIGSLSPSQFWAIILFVAGIVYLGYIIFKKYKKKEPISNSK